MQRKAELLNGESFAVSKEPYRHFMLKEIFEQGKVLADTLEGRVNSFDVLRASFGERALAIFPSVKRVHIVACGTSYHAGLIARYWFEALAGLPVQVDIASEYRYREVVVEADTLFVTISQSGETADTLAALTKAKSLDYLATLAICNVATSSLVREADCVFLTRAGVEIGVASTKAFTTQCAGLLMLVCALSSPARADEVITELKSLPALCEQTLQLNVTIEALAPLFVSKAHTLFLGRGIQYPVALEGALKLKEISYIHAEGYAAGELKHGPIALIDEDMPVIVIAPRDAIFEKTISNMHEVAARGGRIILISDDNAARDSSIDVAATIPMQSMPANFAPIVYAIPVQFLSYYAAIALGTDVDQPRNLAKSVTVE